MIAEYALILFTCTTMITSATDLNDESKCKAIIIDPPAPYVVCMNRAKQGVTVFMGNLPKGPEYPVRLIGCVDSGIARALR